MRRRHELTRISWRQARRRLGKYGDTSVPLRDFTEQYADTFVKKLRASDWAEATQNKIIANLKQFFITRGMTAGLIGACPDHF